LTILCDTR